MLYVLVSIVCLCHRQKAFGAIDLRLIALPSRGGEKKVVKYKVLIHGSKETLNTDLHCTEYPFVIVEEDEGAIGSISKSNLDSISTDENSCAADETNIRAGCQVTKVIKR